MKLVGLIGGVSPESTVVYYRLLNEAARRAYGGDHSAKLLFYTLDYGVMIEQYHKDDWPGFIAEAVKAGEHLKRAGAQALAITSNTTHVAADAVAEATGLPLIHMLDVLANAMKAKEVTRPMLLGTPFVMSGDFYRAALGERYDGQIVTPNKQEQSEVGRIILDELVNGDVKPQSRQTLLDIIAAHECDGVILGCTELCLILSQAHSELAVFDTTALHAEAVSEIMLGRE